MRGARVIATVLMGGLLAAGVMLAGCATGTTVSTPLSNATTTTTLTPPETPSSGRHPDTTASTLATTTTEGTAQPDAAGVVAKLKAAGLPIGGVIIYTAATDVNHMLGRPGGYLSKAAFVDSRVDASQASTEAGDVSRGGGVEVFDNAADAQARETYIQSLIKAMPMLGTEYTYVIGSALVRLSGILTPDQAATYKATLGG